MRSGVLPLRLLDSVDNLRQAVVLVWQSSRRLTLLSILLTLLQGFTPVLQLFLIGRTIDLVTQSIGAGTGTGTAPGAGLAALVVLMGVVMFLDSTLGTIAAVINEAQAVTVSDYILSSIHRHSVNIDLEYYENSQFYNRLHRAQTDAPYRPPQIVNNLLQSARDAFTLAGILLLLISLNTFTPVILFASTLPAVFVRLRFARALFQWQRDVTASERHASYLNYLLTNEYAAKEVRLLNIGGLMISRFSAVRERLRRERLRIVSRRAVFESLVQLLSVAALLTAFWLVISDAVLGTLTIGSLVIAFQGFQRGQATIQSFLSSFTRLYEHNLFLKDYYEFLALPIRIRAPSEPRSVPTPMQQGIRFEGVSFHYAHHQAAVLEDIHLTIKPGEIIALVGENGAGKTTLIKLLCRLYDPTQGRITMDGIDLREFDPELLRQQFAVLFQDYSHYQLSAWENIWLGNIEEPNDPEGIREAALKAGADAVIARLPSGYDTILGSWFDGQELSIGQWQKIALARTFFRDAQLVILDEPTSALDVMAEHEVFDRFQTMIEGRAAILISHRLSTIRMAHRIYVLDQHRIAETGSHDELMEQNGIYARLFTTQSQHYQIGVGEESV